MKKGLAIKIASGILVVALVVVVALAVAGVFSGNKSNDSITANAEDASVSNVAVIRNIATDKVFYITSSKSITDVNSFVKVRANGSYVDLKISDKKDENGNIGFTAKNGWASGVAYRVSIVGGDVAFVEEQYKNMTTFIFIVEAEEAMDCDLSENVVNLEQGTFTLDPILYDDNGIAEKWNLVINNVEAEYAEDVVFVIEDNLDITKIGENGELHSYAVKLDPNVAAVYYADSKQYVATVVNAEVDDVFDTLNVHTNVEIDESNFKFDEEATAASIMNSAMFLSTVQYLYGEQLGSKSFDLNDYAKLVLDYDFKTGSPCYVKFDATLSFKGFLKSAKSATVTIKIANVLTPTFHGNFQKNPLAFDASLDLNVETNVTVSGGFEYSFDNTNDENNTEANVALKNVVNKVAALVGDALNSENKTEKSFIFATWVIPIGTTPIQVVESMGIEVKAEVKAKLSASLRNNFNVELGVAYCDDSLTPIANVKDDFKIGMITLWGAVEAKVGLYNEIGITACGIISVNLDLSVGVYCDVAGRLEMDGWEIMNGNFGIDPVYYIETGIYLDMDISGKVLIFNIKKQRLLSKKWPLWTSGYKYIPEVNELTEEYKACTADEEFYMSSSYFFFTTFKAFSIDIMDINNQGSLRDINWDEFDYTYDKAYLTMVDNKVRVAATAPNEFTTDIVVTSKVNKAWKKTIHVVKTPEAPTTNVPEQEYKKGSNKAVKFAVRLNSSKFIGLSGSKYDFIEEENFTYEDNILKLESSILEEMDYGLNAFLFESSKGYLQLYVNVTTDKTIVPANGFKTVKFDKGNAANAEFAIDLLGNEITAITGGLNDDQWVYSASTGKLKIVATALMEEPVGTSSYGIEFSNGEVGSLNIKIVDTRAAKVNTKNYEYKLDSGAELDLDVILYDNKIEKLVLNRKDVTNYLKKEGEVYLPIINSTYFDMLDKSLTKVEGYIVIGGQEYKISIELGKDSMILVPVKYVDFDKNSAKDVKLTALIPDGVKVSCNNETLGSGVGANFTQNDGYIVISGDYLKGLDNGDYTFKLISSADNAPKFVISISDTTAPVVNGADITAVKGVDKEKKIKWNLAGYSVSVDGLTAAQYRIDDDGLALIVDELAYGETIFSVITPINAFEVKVTVSGSARYLQSDYVFKLNDGKDLVIKTDLAGKKLYEIKFFKDGKEIEIYNTQFRNNNGIITISNDYSYNLEAGTYNVVVYTDENEPINGKATLQVKGALAAYTDVTECDGSENNPYKIYNKAQFLNFIDDTNTKLISWANAKNLVGLGNGSIDMAEDFNDVYFLLMADIDLENATINPIGSKLAAFKGHFNGNGYTISNFKITDVDNDYTGLFAYNEGVIENLRLNKVTVDINKAGNVGIGIVVGYNKGVVKKVIVENSKINAVSKSWLDLQDCYFDIGGIVGYNEGKANTRSIERCEVSVEITAKVKGLKIGEWNIGARKSCVNVGAIVGYFKSGTIYKCDAVADIDAKADNENVNQNGWYGNSELSAAELEECIRRSSVTIK